MAKIKCLALWQPWATLVVEGIKKYETRTHYSSYRGICGILATKNTPVYTKPLFYQDPFYRLLNSQGYNSFEQLPTGGLIGFVTINNWLKMIPSHRKPVHPKVEIPITSNSIEKDLGNWDINRYAIELSNPFKLSEKYSVRGQQGLLFEIDVPEIILNQYKNYVKIN